MGGMAGFGLLVFLFVLESGYLLATYLVVELVAPESLGEVAASPVRFAALISLVKLPMTALHLGVMTRRAWSVFVTRGVTQEPPQRTGWRRIAYAAGQVALDAVETVAAALIVFTYVSDPGDVGLGRLVAISVLGPIVLPRLVSGPFRLVRRWWRRDRPE